MKRPGLHVAVALARVEPIVDEERSVLEREHRPPVPHRIRQTPVTVVLGNDKPAIEIGQCKRAPIVTPPEKRPRLLRLIQPVDADGGVEGSSAESGPACRVTEVAARPRVGHELDVALREGDLKRVRVPVRGDREVTERPGVDEGPHAAASEHDEARVREQPAGRLFDVRAESNRIAPAVPKSTIAAASGATASRFAPGWPRQAASAAATPREARVLSPSKTNARPSSESP